MNLNDEIVPLNPKEDDSALTQSNELGTVLPYYDYLHALTAIIAGIKEDDRRYIPIYFYPAGKSSPIVSIYRIVSRYREEKRVGIQDEVAFPMENKRVQVNAEYTDDGEIVDLPHVNKFNPLMQRAIDSIQSLLENDGSKIYIHNKLIWVSKQGHWQWAADFAPKESSPSGTLTSGSGNELPGGKTNRPTSDSEAHEYYRWEIKHPHDVYYRRPPQG